MECRSSDCSNHYADRRITDWAETKHQNINRLESNLRNVEISAQCVNIIDVRAVRVSYLLGGGQIKCKLWWVCEVLDVKLSSYNRTFEYRCILNFFYELSLIFYALHATKETDELVFLFSEFVLWILHNMLMRNTKVNLQRGFRRRRCIVAFKSTRTVIRRRSAPRYSCWTVFNAGAPLVWLQCIRFFLEYGSYSKQNNVHRRHTRNVLVPYKIK